MSSTAMEGEGRPAPPPPPEDEGKIFHGDLTGTLSLPVADYAIFHEGSRKYTGQGGWMQATVERYQAERSAAWEVVASQRHDQLPKQKVRPAAIRKSKAVMTAIQPGFAPTKQVFYVNGRPCIVYRLRHENSTDEEDIPYLSSIFAPCPIICLSGRSADLAPAVARRQAVWSAWEALLIPLITSPQTPPDCLFFICESDFCMSKAHFDVCDRYMREQQEIAWAGPVMRPSSLDEWREAGAAAEAAASSSLPHDFRAASVQPGTANWWQKTHPTPVPGGFPNRNRILQAMVGLVTFAGRQGKGGLVWISWCPKNDKDQPANGSTCIAVTKQAAHLLHKIMLGASVQPTHFDVWLKNLLKNPKTEEERELCAMSSYVVDPVGGYRTHLSGCEKNLVRTCDWGKVKAYPENSASGGVPRWLCTFGVGPVKSRKIANVPDNLWLLEWKTWLPQRMRDASGEPDQDKLDALLGPPEGFLQAAAEQSASVQPGCEQSAAPAEQSGGASSSTAASWHLPAGLAPATAEDPPEAGLPEIADWDREEYSVISAPSTRPAPRDPVSGDDTEPEQEPRRKRRTMPVDQAQLDEDVESTKHRLRLRRKAARGYFRYRIFTDDQDRCFDRRACWSCISCAHIVHRVPLGQGFLSVHDEA